MKEKRSYLALVVVICGLLAVLVYVLARPDRGVAQSGAQDPGGMNPASSQGLDRTLAPVGTGFTYQGRLEDNNVLANGFYDFEFSLFDASAAGIQIGSTLTHDNVPLTDGLFSVQLDFGASAFGGGERWLQIGVRPGVSVGAYTPLTPRQEISPSPYAMALPNVYTDEGVNFVGVGRNFRISGNEVFGVRYTGSANEYGGMYVETSHANGWPFYGYATNGSFRAWSYYNGTNGDWYLYNAGIRLRVPNEGGLRIGPSADYSLVISNTTGSDGIRIYDTGDDAIQIGNAPDHSNYGVYVPSPGVSNYGLWPNTAEPAGEWALFTVDNIEAGNVVANAYSLVTQVAGSEDLSSGDVVAVVGVGESIPGSTDSMPMVVRAQAGNYAGVIGVVQSRMVWGLAPGKEAEGAMSMHSAEGAAKPGDYVSLIVLGVTDVKVDPGAVIQPGDRLTASSLAGLARPLMKQEINGMTVVEGAPVIGIALAAPARGQDTIQVFVTLR
jgi:hypothetical protein